MTTPSRFEVGEQAELVPPLRADIRLEPLPGDACAVVDAALGRRVKLDARGAKVARALDIPQTLTALADRVGGEPESLARALEGFMKLHLLETPEARRLADDGSATQAMVGLRVDAMPMLTRPDARFTCTMCGSCCGGHNVGPVNAGELAALQPHLARLEAATGSKKGLFLSLPGAAVGTQVLCHSAGGSCVFLTEDRRCRIHAEIGPTLKPRPCRIFPYEFIATPRGIAVTIQRECRGFAEAREGRLLSESLDELREVAALAGRLPNVRPIIKFQNGKILDWTAYEALEETLHAIVDDEAYVLERSDGTVSEAQPPRERAEHVRDPSATLVAMAAAIAATRGAPATEAATITPIADPGPTLGAELAAIAATITTAMQQMKQQVPAPNAELLVRADGLDHALHALATLRPDFRRIVHPLERPDQRSLFRDHLHHGLMAKELLIADTLEAGFGRMVFEWMLAKSLAIHRAREVKRRHLVTQDVMDGLVVVSFLFRHDYFQKALLPGLDARVTALFFEQLGTLVAHAAAVPEPDTRTELVKF